MSMDIKGQIGSDERGRGGDLVALGKKSSRSTMFANIYWSKDTHTHTNKQTWRSNI